MTENSSTVDAYQAVAEYYDYVPPYQERKDVGFFVEEALVSGGPVLEIGCGTGRVLIPTAREGIMITGIDISSNMLAVCRKRLSQEPQEVQDRVTLNQGDMRDFELPQSFQLVTMPFRPFQHLMTTADQIACLKRVHSHLVKGGKLILDLFNPSLEALLRETGEETEEGPEFKMPDGRRVTRSDKINSRDLFNQCSNIDLIYYVTYLDGREERIVHRFDMRYLFRFEVEHLLERCGFSVAHLYAGYDRSAYGSVYPGELIFIAGKR